MTALTRQWSLHSKENKSIILPPGDGMVMLAMVLQSVGLPVEGIALVAGVDRVFDMGRTTVNITGDSSCAIIVSALEKRKALRREKKASAET